MELETNVVPKGNLAFINTRTAKYEALIPHLRDLGTDNVLMVKPPEGINPQMMATSVRKMVAEKMDTDGLKLKTRTNDDGRLALWWVEAKPKGE